MAAIRLAWLGKTNLEINGKKMTDLREFASQANAWPFVEARALLKNINNKAPEKGYVLFETGYGPSGLPHIGTFGEVARTTMVRQAFSVLSDIPTRLVAFSDDMDGLRKVPDNIPNKEMITEHLGKPLSSIPDPFGTHESFAAHNNARLQAFLDEFGFEYEFKSATDCYKSGEFDPVLLAVLERYDAVINVVLPTLGLGGIHRNTFLNAPKLMDDTLRLHADPRLRFAGQITGCEGYVESAAVGLLTGRFAAAERLGNTPAAPPLETALGALLGHITGGADAETYQPMNINFGLFPPLGDEDFHKKIRKRGKDRKKALSDRALTSLNTWLSSAQAAAE